MQTSDNNWAQSTRRWSMVNILPRQRLNVRHVFTRCGAKIDEKKETWGETSPPLCSSWSHLSVCVTAWESLCIFWASRRSSCTTSFHMASLLLSVFLCDSVQLCHEQEYYACASVSLSLAVCRVSYRVGHRYLELILTLLYLTSLEMLCKLQKDIWSKKGTF